MKAATRAFLAIRGVVALALLASTGVAGVPVGSSTLIKVLDYSDSFTGTDHGGLPDRDAAGGYPLSKVDYPANGTLGEGLAVENCYGNPAQSWTDGMWSIAADATVNPGNSGYAAGSGSGSETGMTQTGGWSGDWGIRYGLRNRFVVQFDAVQSNDRIDLVFGSVRDTMWDTANLSVFVRITEHLQYPEIGIYNGTAGIGERDTGLTSGINYAGEWHNYAALVDVPKRTIEVFVDQLSHGVIDLDTVGGGAFASVPLVNTYVNFGWFGQDRCWTDNFQIGSPDSPSDDLPGDANRDKKVDDLDASILAANWQLASGATWAQADFNGDGMVTDLDASILASNWQAGVGSAVPEPAFAVLVLSALAGWGLLRRRM